LFRFSEVEAEDEMSSKTAEGKKFNFEMSKYFNVLLKYV
jgi:hypothetical protein